jgi:uncharacterized protein YndB with AHSA1/START domain
MGSGRERCYMPANDYVFVEEWFIPAAAEDVWTLIADGRLLPQWWRGVYLEAEPLGEYTEPKVGQRLRAKARGFLPYRLNFIIETTELERPRVVAVRTHGDLTGSWRATLTQEEGGTRVHTEERVSADKPALRFLSPILKPVFARNHYWTTPRAQAGMTAYLAEHGKLIGQQGAAATGTSQ